jgi:chaperonin GroES
LALSAESANQAARSSKRAGAAVCIPETEVFNMKLKPLGDRLIVRAIEEDEKTASGIVLPDTAKEKPQKGTVVAVGEGKLDDDGKRVPLEVKKGDEVLYSKYGGTEIKDPDNGDDLLVLRESDVLAKVA